MDLEKLQARLYAAARAEPRDERVPYAFEKRVLARIEGSRPPDPALLWNRILWRAAAPCLGIMLLAAAWNRWQSPPADPAETLAQDLESAVYAAFELPEDLW